MRRLGAYEVVTKTFIELNATGARFDKTGNDFVLPELPPGLAIHTGNASQVIIVGIQVCVPAGVCRGDIVIGLRMIEGRMRVKVRAGDADVLAELANHLVESLLRASFFVDGKVIGQLVNPPMRGLTQDHYQAVGRSNPQFMDHPLHFAWNVEKAIPDLSFGQIMLLLIWSHHSPGGGGVNDEIRMA